MPTLAQRLRKNPTPAEVRFWSIIEPLRLGAYHFRKQVAIGPYIANFACHHAKLIVEIDGDTHYTDTGMQRDSRRDTLFSEKGYSVLRFTNLDVMDNAEGVYDTVIGALEVTP